jgi:SAM-dependent methyltransferase
VALYALTIFLSAFLLFQVQPLIGKYILPWFGGGPTIWTTCMLFFQMVLLAGYAYAHLVRTHLKERRQAVVHAALLVGAVLLLPIAPSAAWKPEEAGDPTWRILLVLAASVGVPYFALSATSPLLQAWFSVTHPGRSPYRLYALSNAGSLLALASYPFLIEPELRLKTQTLAWSAGFVVFVIFGALCALRLWRAEPAAAAAEAPAGEAPSAPRPGWGTWVLWLLLPACGSVMLLAVTNQMCMDVGVVPFLWVLPLSLYLLSFIVVFNNERAYWRPVFWPLLAAAAGVMIYVLFRGVYLGILWQVAGHSAVLFVCCMVCHGELARLKPDPRRLTAFYLMSSAGGAVGGLLVTIVAPLVFSGYRELHYGLIACLTLAAAAYLHERWVRGQERPVWKFIVFTAASLAVVIGTLIGLGYQIRAELESTVSMTRNFYGVLQVEQHGSDYFGDLRYILRHGRILHGCQYASGVLRRKPTEYYWEKTGVGLSILNRRPGSPLRVGVVGLGTGTLAAYGREGDVYRFYEINPQVQRLATTQFTYLKDNGARCEVVLGDARLSLEREPPQQYDVLALDAFTSDAIPIHLLTLEAFEIYQRHLKPDGILAVHISNRFLDLRPVVVGLAQHLGMASAIIHSGDENKTEYSPATWVLVTRDRAFLESPAIEPSVITSAAEDKPFTPRVWTDDYSDLLSLVK